MTIRGSGSVSSLTDNKGFGEAHSSMTIRGSGSVSSLTDNKGFGERKLPDNKGFGERKLPDGYPRKIEMLPTR